MLVGDPALNALSATIIGAAIEVHRELGPGLLESAYQACLVHELTLRRVRVETQQPLRLLRRVVNLRDSPVIGDAPGHPGRDTPM